MPRPAKTRSNSGLSLILAGLLLISLALLYRLHQSRILSFSSTVLADKSFTDQKITGARPVKISIPTIKLNLNIAEAAIVNGTWDISFTGASHLVNSANPGTPGNIIIYGHNKNSLFGPIRWLSVGDTIHITDQTGQIHPYQISQTLTTTPENIQYILPKSEEILTLYTCTGLFDSQRFIVLARPLTPPQSQK